jgi:hypothetical protein
MRDRASKLARVDAQIERTLKKRTIEIEKRRMVEVTIREFPAAAKRAVLAELLFHLYNRKRVFNTERKSLEIKMLPASILNICIEENTDMIVEYRTRWAAFLARELKSAERKLKREEERSKPRCTSAPTGDHHQSTRREALRYARHQVEFYKKKVDLDEEEETVQDIARVIRSMRGIEAAGAGNRKQQRQRVAAAAATAATTAAAATAAAAAATGGIFEWFKCEGFSYTNGNAEDRGVIID